MYHVYAIVNPEGTIYIGQTDDLDRRLNQHRTGDSGWTKTRGPWSLVLHEPFQTRAQAMRREKTLKSGRLNQQLRQLARERAQR